ncbi:hypothetical protein CVT25_000280 [Psilocybe cyanescens]|uniref:MARVEL domain-containing protein n=1 Tax=Psilocybe cyanescens TaxID=93625 RepID=A0A409XM32_PSICY|nr:hypothetical protein CVT25_000280 [Psilocybe cyanescens]
MIIDPQEIVASNADSSDVASTNTLVRSEHKFPHHLLKLVYASLFVSTLAFTFSIIDKIKSDPQYTVLNAVVATILAFIFTLPHHGATLLLKWRPHHQISYVLPFAPSSARAIGYLILLVGLWFGSTVVCARSLQVASSSRGTVSYTITPSNSTIKSISVTHPIPPELDDYWTSLASTLTSTVELILISTIALISYLYYRQQNKEYQAEPSNDNSQSVGVKGHISVA